MTQIGAVPEGNNPGVARMIVTDPLAVSAVSSIWTGLTDDDRFRTAIATRADDFDCVQSERAHLVVNGILNCSNSIEFNQQEEAKKLSNSAELFNV